MNRSDDKKLEIFLNENRPLHPRHSEREAEKIWAQISKSKPPLPFWTQTRVALGAFATAGALVLALNVTHQRTPAPAALDETALVEETLGLDFMENGEIYEVTDLLSLAK